MPSSPSNRDGVVKDEGNRWLTRNNLLIGGSLLVIIGIVVPVSVALSGGSAETPSAASSSPILPVQVGSHNKIKISSDDGTENDIMPHRGQEGIESTKEYIIDHPDASYISVHFSRFDFDDACRMEISDNDGTQLSVLTGRGRGNLSAFWARHVNGDTMVIKVICDHFGAKADFEIDDYVAGYEGAQVSLFEPGRVTRRKLGGWNPFRINRDLTTCGDEDTRNAICYAQSHPVQYEKARAVARLLIRGSSVCTGWLVGTDNILMTNDHCIHTNDDALQTDFEFMYEANENADCNSPNVYDRVTGKSVFDADRLLISNEIDDFALIQLQGDAVSQFGHLELDPRIPEDGEQIYIPQHPGGQDKVLGIFDTHAPGGLCQVMNTNSGKCDNRQQYFDVSYSCDTQGGSSGSPVLSNTNNKVVALHHCGGGCGGNVGVPIAEIWSQIESYFTSTPQPTPNPTPQPTPDGCQHHTVEITLNFDMYASETTWELKDRNDNVVAEGSGYRDNDQRHSSKHCVEDGAHTVVVHDTFGDGLCCDYATESYPGNYEVLYDGVAVDDGNGRFGAKKTVSLVETPVPTVSPLTDTDTAGQSCEDHELKVEVMTDQFGAETYWRLFDSDGIELFEGGMGYNNNQLHEDKVCIGNGIYTFTIYDSFHDGFCCDFGEGYFEVFYDGTKVAEHNGDIGASYSVIIGDGTGTNRSEPKPKAKTNTIHANPKSKQAPLKLVKEEARSEARSSEPLSTLYHHLGECQGDCDYDYDCGYGMFCWQRDEGEGVPSCDGNPGADHLLADSDYCVYPWKLPQEEYGHNWLVITHEDGEGIEPPLYECQGDCDDDNDCVGDLQCLALDGANVSVPGCQGVGETAYDYCYDPNKA